MSCEELATHQQRNGRQRMDLESIRVIPRKKFQRHGEGKRYLEIPQLSLQFHQPHYFVRRQHAQPLIFNHTQQGVSRLPSHRLKHVMQEEDHCLRDQSRKNTHRVRLGCSTESLDACAQPLVQPLMARPERIGQPSPAKLLDSDLLAMRQGPSTDRRQNDALSERGQSWSTPIRGS